MNETSSLPKTVAKYAVTTGQLPALAHFMHDYLANEPYDPHFLGQPLATTYFDTLKFPLRQARRKGDRYATLRIRRYPGGMCMLQIKTPEEKVRIPIGTVTADILEDEPFTIAPVPAVTTLGSLVDVPPTLLAVLLDLVGDEELLPVAKVCYRRYAIEDDQERLTLDVDVHTDAGKGLPFHVLEIKGSEDHHLPAALEQVKLRPMKLSKFLWATEV